MNEHDFQYHFHYHPAHLRRVADNERLRRQLPQRKPRLAKRLSLSVVVNILLQRFSRM